MCRLPLHSKYLSVSIAFALSQIQLLVTISYLSKLYFLTWWAAGVVICLERGADLHMAQLMPLPLASVKSRLVLPFWYRLTRVVPDKGPLNGCMYFIIFWKTVD